MDLTFFAFWMAQSRIDTIDTLKNVFVYNLLNHVTLHAIAWSVLYPKLLRKSMSPQFFV